MTIRVELKKEDAWVGVFWRRAGTRLDVWVCLIPFVPIHYWYYSKETSDDGRQGS